MSITDPRPVSMLPQDPNAADKLAKIQSDLDETKVRAHLLALLTRQDLQTSCPEFASWIT